jgi:zinc protease
MDNVRRLLNEAFADDIEVVITGDVTVDEAIRQTAATFGALPARRNNAPVAAAARNVRFPAGTRTPVELKHKGRADQAVGLIAWPTTGLPQRPPDGADAGGRSGGDAAPADGGAQGEPGGDLFAGRAGNLGLRVPGLRLRRGGARGAAREAGKLLRRRRQDRGQPAGQPRHGRRARARRASAVEQIQRSQASNEYWLGQLGGAHTDPRRLEAVRESISGLQRVTAADVQRAARSYLVGGKAYRLVVTPQAQAAAAAPRTGGR